LIYLLTRQFGTAAQAGYGTGSRIMQAIFLPGMAIAFAAAPVAGQNFGAKYWDRVRATLRVSVIASVVIMTSLTLFCQWRADLLIRLFTADPHVIAEGGEFLRIISWNFIATGIIFSCSGLFQALGNTWPSLISSGSRLLTFALPAFWFSLQPGFRIETLWYISVASVAFQAVISLLLVRREFLRRLPKAAPMVEAQAAG